MEPAILKNYAVCIEENEKFQQIKSKEIEISKSYVKFDDSTLSINFRDAWNNDLRSKLPKLEFTNEEKSEIAKTILDVIENKYKSNLEKAKADYKKMLIDKL